MSEPEAQVESEEQSKENETNETPEEAASDDAKENEESKEEGSDKPKANLGKRMFMDVPDRSNVGFDGQAEEEFE